MKKEVPKMNDTLPTLNRRRALALFGDDTGAATAEYAITTMAAVAFAGLLVPSCARMRCGASSRGLSAAP